MPRQQQQSTEKNQLALGGHFNAQLISFFLFSTPPWNLLQPPADEQSVSPLVKFESQYSNFPQRCYKLVHFPGLLVDVSISEVAADLSVNFRKGFMLIGVSSINSPLTRASRARTV